MTGCERGTESAKECAEERQPKKIGHTKLLGVIDCLFTTTGCGWPTAITQHMGFSKFSVNWFLPAEMQKKRRVVSTFASPSKRRFSGVGGANFRAHRHRFRPISTLPASPAPERPVSTTPPPADLAPENKKAATRRSPLESKLVCAVSAGWAGGSRASPGRCRPAAAGRCAPSRWRRLPSSSRSSRACGRWRTSR